MATEAQITAEARRAADAIYGVLTGLKDDDNFSAQDVIDVQATLLSGCFAQFLGLFPLEMRTGIVTRITVQALGRAEALDGQLGQLLAAAAERAPGEAVPPIPEPTGEGWGVNGASKEE